MASEPGRRVSPVGKLVNGILDVIGGTGGTECTLPSADQKELFWCLASQIWSHTWRAD